MSLNPWDLNMVKNPLKTQIWTALLPFQDNFNYEIRKGDENKRSSSRIDPLLCLIWEIFDDRGWQMNVYKCFRDTLQQKW